MANPQPPQPPLRLAREADAGASLVWVIVDGAPRHVSDFAHLPAPRRPASTCPQCGRRLTLKLGDVRRHHAAHAAGQSCAATNPETALHLGCKLALAHALRASIPLQPVLSIVQHCADSSNSSNSNNSNASVDRPVAGPCTERRVAAWVDGWHEVLVEHRIGDGQRPDIMLLRGGTPLGALEIVVSNAVSAEKARALQALGIPWIEIRAEEWLTTPGAWTPREPLRVERTGDTGVWRCALHAARYEAAVAARARAHDAAREAARHTSVLRAARVVDLYHQGGARERFIYRVVEELVDGVVASLCLRRGTLQLSSIPVESSDELRAVWPRLRTAFLDDVERLARGGSSFADSPMRWARGDAAENLVGEALADRVGRDPTPLASRYPRRWFYAPRDERWFLPDDMRDVRWDRTSPDAFAEHPAWARARSAVRERPAPEGSWSTPVFAARPVAALFTGYMTAAERRVDESIAVVELRGPAPSDGSGAGGGMEASPVHRALVVVERTPAPGTVAAVSARLADEGIEALWISHPLDWCDEFAALAWAPAGRDASGRGMVVVDGEGIFRAAQFTRALARGDRRLSSVAIRARMQGRVRGLTRGGDRAL